MSAETYITRSGMKVWNAEQTEDYLSIGITGPCFMFLDWPWMMGFAGVMQPIPNVFFMPDEHSVDDPTKLRIVQGVHEIVLRTCWDAYRTQLDNGIDPGTAMAVLPLSLYGMVTLTADQEHWRLFIDNDGFGCGSTVLKEVARLVDDWI